MLLSFYLIFSFAEDYNCSFTIIFFLNILEVPDKGEDRKQNKITNLFGTVMLLLLKYSVMHS